MKMQRVKKSSEKITIWNGLETECPEINTFFYIYEKRRDHYPMSRIVVINAWVPSGKYHESCIENYNLSFIFKNNLTNNCFQRKQTNKNNINKISKIKKK